MCGGLALTNHEFSRATYGFDILIRLESLEKAYEIAELFGYDIRGLDMSFKERAVEIRRVSKIDDDGEVLPLDFLLTTAQVEDVWETREGLIKMKELAGKAKDLINIDRIKNEDN